MSHVFDESGRLTSAAAHVLSVLLSRGNVREFTLPPEETVDVTVLCDELEEAELLTRDRLWGKEEVHFFPTRFTSVALTHQKDARKTLLARAYRASELDDAYTEYFRVQAVYDVGHRDSTARVPNYDKYPYDPKRQ